MTWCYSRNSKPLTSVRGFRIDSVLSKSQYLFLGLFLLFTYLASPVHSIAVISVDLGNDFYKIGLVKPGVPMEIVLNSESKRKTPTVVTLKSDERLFGDAALNAGIRKPKNMFTHFLDLIGEL